ncbi:MAG: YajQ family cyclic di-GMP-binding protein, partial [Gammaproteobacteria bacterium]
HELTNAVDQANREVGNRFDFKGSGAKFEQIDAQIKMTAASEFQLKQMLDILYSKLTRRGLPLEGVEPGKVETHGKIAEQAITVKQGIDQDSAKKMVKLIKDSKLKVQAAIQGDKLRVTGKKRDDLQAVMALLREAKLGLPLQFNNFRD